MPAPNTATNGNAASGKSKASRYTPPKTSISKLLKAKVGQLKQVNQATVALGCHMYALATLVLTGLFGFGGFFYRSGLLVLAGVNGSSAWAAYKAQGGRLSGEMFKAHAAPYTILCCFAWLLTSRPLMPLQLALAVHSALAILKALSASPRFATAVLSSVPQAAKAPAEQQAKMVAQAVNNLEPRVLLLASHLEILAVPWAVLSAVRGKQSLLLPVLLVQFVRFLLVTQERTQGAWKAWAAQLEHGLTMLERKEGLPAVIRQYAKVTKGFLLKKPAAKAAVPKAE